MRKSILNLRSTKPQAPRFCDVIVDGESVGKRAGIPTSTISEWKKRKTNPSADKIMDICVALEVTPEELLTGRGIDEEQGLEDSEREDKMTPIDWQIIKDYHGMKEAQKRRLLKYMEALKQLEELEELE